MSSPEKAFEFYAPEVVIDHSERRAESREVVRLSAFHFYVLSREG
jgi:hypothetical protein